MTNLIPFITRFQQGRDHIHPDTQPAPGNIPDNHYKPSGQNRIRILRSDGSAILLLTIIWAAAGIIINPSGEFPLNDDWSYTRSLQHLYEDHQFRLEGWTSMPLLGQLIWGLLFCKLFGFSFTILRFSTMLMGLAGTIGAYLLAREFTTDKKLCFFPALILLLNPIYCNLSATFMTDVPFTALFIYAILFFVKTLRTGRADHLLTGLTFVVMATMIRQLGLLAAGAFSIAWLLTRGFRPGPILIAAISSILPLGIYLGYNHWIRTTGNYPSKYDEGFKRVLFALFSPGHSTIRLLLRQTLTILIYCGLFIFPGLFLFDWRRIWHKWRVAAGCSLALMIISTGYCLFYKPVMPQMGNIMNSYGLGPLSLRDTSILQSTAIHPLPAILWQMASLAGILGAGAIVLLLISQLTGTKKKRLPDIPPANQFLLLLAGFYFVIVLVGGTYDRYLLPLIPILTTLMIDRFSKQAAPAKKNYALAGLLLLPIAYFSIAGTADYMSWNRARWKAITWLTRDKAIKPEKIDGGFEYNGYMQYNETDITAIKEKADPEKKSWWWVGDDQYLLAFGPVKGYRTMTTVPYSRHLGTTAPTGDNIYVLQKEE